MIKGFLLSVLLHSFLWVLLFFILPNIFYKQTQIIDVSVDIISLEELFPIVVPEKIVKDEKVVEQPEIIDKITETLTLPENIEVKEKPLIKTVIIEESIIQEEDEEEGFNLDSMLAEIKAAQDKERDRLASERAKYGNNLTSNEKSAVRQQINNCWSNIVNKLFNIEELEGIKVKILVSLDKDGNVLKVKQLDTLTPYMKIDNILYRQVVDSVSSTFIRCNKIIGLPKAKYDSWKDFEFIFDPNELK